MKDILILGTGGNCIDILDTINEINLNHQRTCYHCVGFLDDDPMNWGKVIHGVKVLGPLPSAGDYPDAFFVNGIGSENNFWKKSEIIAKCKMPIEKFETIIHPTASISKMSTLGYGTVIFQNVTITSGISIGDHVMVLPNTVISHDSTVEDYTIFAGGVCSSGGVKVGFSCYLGTNCSIKSNLTIGRCSLVGMGSVVLKDIPENTVVVGNPARFLRNTTESDLVRLQG